MHRLAEAADDLSTERAAVSLNRPTSSAPPATAARPDLDDDRDRRHLSISRSTWALGTG